MEARGGVERLLGEEKGEEEQDGGEGGEIGGAPLSFPGGSEGIKRGGGEGEGEGEEGGEGERLEEGGRGTEGVLLCFRGDLERGE